MDADSQGLVVDELTGVNIDDVDGEDDDSLTPAEVLRIMTQSYVNEISSPILLPHKFTYVDCLVQQMEHMEEIIARQSDKTNVKMTAHRMELYRITYIVNAYIRSRLKKIEECPHEVLAEHQQRMAAGHQSVELLEERELFYAEGLCDRMGRLFNESFLKLLPERMQRLPVPKRLDTARRERVFVEVAKENIEDVAVPDMTDADAQLVISMGKGEKLFLPFASIEDHLEHENVNLL